jgi:hypothetical protein
MIDRIKVSNVFHEWTRDSYRTPNPANASIEGADASYAAQVQPGPLNNRTQIIQDTVSVSNTAEEVKKYGRSSEIARLKMKKMIELRRDIEAAALGNPAAVTGSGATAGQMRGLYGFIAANAAVGATGVAPNPVTNTAPVAGTDGGVAEVGHSRRVSERRRFVGVHDLADPQVGGLDLHRQRGTAAAGSVKQGQ